MGIFTRMLSYYEKPDFICVVMKNFNHITYQTFGIDPKEFYAGKFLGACGTVDWLADPKNHFHLEFGRARFLTRNIKGPRVLDLGCGSAPFAQTLRRHSEARE